MICAQEETSCATNGPNSQVCPSGDAAYCDSQESIYRGVQRFVGEKGSQRVKTKLLNEASGAENSDETCESFAFALVNGALGVFEVHGRRIRDFRYFNCCLCSFQLLKYNQMQIW